MPQRSPLKGAAHACYVSDPGVNAWATKTPNAEGRCSTTMDQNLPPGCLPPRELWPERIFTTPELQYPDQLNACRELLDANITAGRGARPAILYNNQIITYSDLCARVQTLAGALLEMGLTPGDRVMLRFANHPEFIITWLAVLRIGGICVSTMPLLRARELGAIANDCAPAFLFTESDLWDEAEKIIRPGVFRHVVVAGEKKNGAKSWDEVMATPRSCPAADTAAEGYRAAGLHVRQYWRAERNHSYASRYISHRGFLRAKHSCSCFRRHLQRPADHGVHIRAGRTAGISVSIWSGHCTTAAIHRGRHVTARSHLRRNNTVCERHHLQPSTQGRFA